MDTSKDHTMKYLDKAAMAISFTLNLQIKDSKIVDKIVNKKTNLIDNFP